MKEEKINFKKITLYVISIIIFIWALFNLSLVGNILSYVIAVLFPFLLGTLFALILNIPMKFFERKFRGKKDTKINKLKRGIALILSVILIILVIALIIVLILPQLIKVTQGIISHIPYYQEQLNNILDKLELRFPDVSFVRVRESISTSILNLKDGVINQIPSLLNSTVSIATTAIGVVMNFIIAVVFAFYILMDKERLKQQLTKVAYAYLKESKARKIIHTVKAFVRCFSDFVSAQFMEVIIISTICSIGLSILRMPYAVPVGILVGICAIIPFIGTTIGMIIGAILIVSVSPIKTVVFVVFILIIQQIDGNIIYPRVVGNRVGLPGIWVIFAIVIGSSLFGIIGAIIAVPIGSTIYFLIKEKIKRSEILNDKNNKKELID